MGVWWGQPRSPRTCAAPAAEVAAPAWPGRAADVVVGDREAGLALLRRSSEAGQSNALCISSKTIGEQLQLPVGLPAANAALAAHDGAQARLLDHAWCCCMKSAQLYPAHVVECHARSLPVVAPCHVVSHQPWPSQRGIHMWTGGADVDQWLVQCSESALILGHSGIMRIRPAGWLRSASCRSPHVRPCPSAMHTRAASHAITHGAASLSNQLPFKPGCHPIWIVACSSWVRCSLGGPPATAPIEGGAQPMSHLKQILSCMPLLTQPRTPPNRQGDRIMKGTDQPHPSRRICRRRQRPQRGCATGRR